MTGDDSSAVTVSSGAPPSGSVPSKSTRSPARTLDAHRGCAGRPSAAATVSAAGAPPGPAMLPNAGPACPSFPAGTTTSMSRVVAPATARASGPSGNDGVRLGDADERDARGIVRVAVLVRIDRGLEPGEDLVGPRVHGVPALRVRLPAGDPDREDRGAGRDSVQAPGPVRAGDDPGELGPVPLRTARNRRMRLGDAAAPRGDHVDARTDALPEVGMREIDARVEQRDRDAAPVEAGNLEPAARADGGHAQRLGRLAPGYAARTG